MTTATMVQSGNEMDKTGTKYEPPETVSDNDTGDGEEKQTSATNSDTNGTCVHSKSDLEPDVIDVKECKEPLLTNGLKTGDVNVNDLKASVNQTDGCVNQKHSPGKPELERVTSCYDNAPDGGWGWMVTFSAFMVGVILDGISFSFGIFFKELLIQFQESKSLTSWIISVFNGTYLGLGPVASVLVSIFGCRKVAIFGAVLASVSLFLSTWSPNVQVMILLYGLLGGTGLGLLYLPAIVTVGHYFKKRRALATGIAVCGSGIGAFVFAPLSELLIEMYSWKGAMWIIAAIVLNGVPIAALLRPLEGSEEPMIDRWMKSRAVRKELSQTRENGADMSLLQKQSQQNGHVDRNVAIEEEPAQCCDVNSMFDFELLKSATFLVYGSSCFLCMLGFYIPFTYIPDLADEFGLTSQEGAMLISIIGILNTVARILVGYVADRPWADSLIINSVALVIGGVATMFVPFYASFGFMATYSVVFGISIAVFVSLRSIIMAELLGIEKLSSSFGLVTMCQGLSAFIGAPIAGALSDIAGDYKGAFYMAGAAIAMSGTICFPLRRISKWELRHTGAAGNSAIIYTSDMELQVKGRDTV